MGYQNMMNTPYIMVARLMHVGRHVQQRKGTSLHSLLLLGTGATGRIYQRASKGVGSASPVRRMKFSHIMLRL